MNAREWAREYLKIAEKVDESREVSGKGLCDLLWVAEKDSTIFPDREEGRRWRQFCKNNFVSCESYSMIEDTIEDVDAEGNKKDWTALAIEAQQIRVLILCFTAAMTPWYMKRQRDLRRKEARKQLKRDGAVEDLMAYGMFPEEAILRSGS